GREQVGFLVQQLSEADCGTAARQWTDAGRVEKFLSTRSPGLTSHRAGAAVQVCPDWREGVIPLIEQHPRRGQKRQADSPNIIASSRCLACGKRDGRPETVGRNLGTLGSRVIVLVAHAGNGAYWCTSLQIEDRRLDRRRADIQGQDLHRLTFSCRQPS